jgi:hypothetical protein
MYSEMSREKLIKLLEKELGYQVSIFGDYRNDPNLNVASLILMIKVYLEKAEKAYVSKWKHEMPDWLLRAKEQGDTVMSPGSAPVKTYEELIKVFALTGAAIEAFANIDPEHWREDGIKDKWNI